MRSSFFSLVIFMKYATIRQRSGGFTLIELIVVIVILGILAATGLTKFIDLGGDARTAAVQGMVGTLNSAAQLVQSAWIVQGGSGLSTVTMADGSTVAVNPASGFPTTSAAGIGAAINCTSVANCSGYTPSFGLAATFKPSGSSTGGCQASYTPAGTATPSIGSC